jgi:hypothetical protein
MDRWPRLEKALAFIAYYTPPVRNMAELRVSLAKAGKAA